jgi:hypothetical protein
MFRLSPTHTLTPEGPERIKRFFSTTFPGIYKRNVLSSTEQRQQNKERLSAGTSADSEDEFTLPTGVKGSEITAVQRNTNHESSSLTYFHVSSHILHVCALSQFDSCVIIRL